MRVIVAVNQVTELSFRQTTALLVVALLRRGCDVWLADVDAFSLLAHAGARGKPELDDLNQIQVVAFQVPPSCTSSAALETAAAAAAEFLSLTLSPTDLLLIRTNPGRDLGRIPLHDSMLQLCRLAETQGVRVINSPRNLAFFASKSSLALLDPKFRPATLVTSCTAQITSFVRDSPGDCVIKPLFGSRGENVIRVANTTTNLAAQLAETFGTATLVAQHFVTADHPGDRRVVTVGGQLLEIDGQLAAIERHPAANDFRANLHAGGTAHPVPANDLGANARAAVEHAAKLVTAHGIWLCGVDLIGDQIIELNVFSTGGLYDASRFSGIDFAEAVISRLFSTIA